LAVPAEPIWQMSVEQYHAIIEAGILTDDDPIELLEGWLVLKMSKKPPHRVVTGLIGEALRGLIGHNWYVDLQEPITTTDSEPEPDIAVIRGNRLDYLERHPGPREVGLVIEVAEATLTRDQQTKKRIYARAGIPVYWIVNLVKQQVEVYTQPMRTGKQPTYRRQQVYDIDGEVPVVLDGVDIGRLAVKEILPFVVTTQAV
jgi:Uma2 family endonuclease